MKIKLILGALLALTGLPALAQYPAPILRNYWTTNAAPFNGSSMTNDSGYKFADSNQLYTASNSLQEQIVGGVAGVASFNTRVGAVTLTRPDVTNILTGTITNSTTGNAATASAGWPTQWPGTALTNTYLTNWAKVDTNVLATAGRTQWAVGDVTNAGTLAYSNSTATDGRYMLSSQNLTNWGTLSTNALGTGGGVTNNQFLPGLPVGNGAYITNVVSVTGTRTNIIGSYAIPIGTIYATNIDVETGSIHANAGTRIYFEGSYIESPSDNGFEFNAEGAGGIPAKIIGNSLGGTPNTAFIGEHGGLGTWLTNIPSSAITNVPWITTVDAQALTNEFATTNFAKAQTNYMATTNYVWSAIGVATNGLGAGNPNAITNQGTMSNMTHTVSATTGLKLLWPTTGNGSEFLWKTDHLRLTNWVWGDWMEWNNGFTIGKGVSTVAGGLDQDGKLYWVGAAHGDGSGITNLASSSITNAPWITSQRVQWSVGDITNAGTAAYSNSAAFLKPSEVGTAAYSNKEAFLMPSQVGNLAYSNGITTAEVVSGTFSASRLPVGLTNAIGAVKADGTSTSIAVDGTISAVAGATTSTNTPLSSIQGGAAGQVIWSAGYPDNRWTNTPSVSVSNLYGVLPAGTVAEITNTGNGFILGNSNQARVWTRNAGSLTNLNATELRSGTLASDRLLTGGAAGKLPRLTGDGNVWEWVDYFSKADYTNAAKQVYTWSNTFLNVTNALGYLPATNADLGYLARSNNIRGSNDIVAGTISSNLFDAATYNLLTNTGTTGAGYWEDAGSGAIKFTNTVYIGDPAYTTNLFMYYVDWALGSSNGTLVIGAPETAGTALQYTTLDHKLIVENLEVQGAVTGDGFIGMMTLSGNNTPLGTNTYMGPTYFSNQVTMTNLDAGTLNASEANFTNAAFLGVSNYIAGVFGSQIATIVASNLNLIELSVSNVFYPHTNTFPYFNGDGLITTTNLPLYISEVASNAAFLATNNLVITGTTYSNISEGGWIVTNKNLTVDTNLTVMGGLVVTNQAAGSQSNYLGGVTLITNLIGGASGGSNWFGGTTIITNLSGDGLGLSNTVTLHNDGNITITPDGDGRGFGIAASLEGGAATMADITNSANWLINQTNVVFKVDYTNAAKQVYTWSNTFDNLTNALGYLPATNGAATGVTNNQVLPGLPVADGAYITNVVSVSGTFTNTIGSYAIPVGNIYVTNIDVESGDLHLNAGSRLHFEGSYVEAPRDDGFDFYAEGAGLPAQIIGNPMGGAGNTAFFGEHVGNGAWLTNVIGSNVVNAPWQLASENLTNWSLLSTNLFASQTQLEAGTNSVLNYAYAMSNSIWINSSNVANQMTNGLGAGGVTSAELADATNTTHLRAGLTITGTPTGSKFIRDDWTLQTVGAGSQTPWEADINAAQFWLTNAGTVQATNVNTTNLNVQGSLVVSNNFSAMQSNFLGGVTVVTNLIGLNGNGSNYFGGVTVITNLQSVTTALLTNKVYASNVITGGDLANFLPAGTVATNAMADGWHLVSSNATRVWSVNGGMLTNIYSTNLNSRGVYYAGNNGVVIDSSRVFTTFITNATYVISGFSGLVSGAQNAFTLQVSNSAATTIWVSNAPNCRLIGPGTTNALAIGAAKVGYFSWHVGGNMTNAVSSAEQ